MQTFISFLRGINMTGHNSIKMADLAKLYTSLGFKNVETFIQSGNVIIDADMSELEISLKIEAEILRKFNYNVPVMVRTVQEIKDLYSTNPFLNEENFNPARMAVIFLLKETTAEQIQKVIDIEYPPDRFEISGKEIYIYCPNGFGRSKIYTNFFEKKMGVVGTGRNWKTITAILNIAEQR